MLSRTHSRPASRAARHHATADHPTAALPLRRTNPRKRCPPAPKRPQAAHGSGLAASGDEEVTCVDPGSRFEPGPVEIRQRKERVQGQKDCPNDVEKFQVEIGGFVHNRPG